MEHCFFLSLLAPLARFSIESPLSPGMFWQVRDALSHCIRIDPTHGDFGGFFCALFEKVAPGPASLPPKVATSAGIPRPEPRLKEAEMSKVKEKSLNPIPSLLAAPNSTQLQWLVDWFGLQSDVEEASRLGVQHFPLELVRADPNLKETGLQHESIVELCLLYLLFWMGLLLDLC